jgi:hypothetical protein
MFQTNGKGRVIIAFIKQTHGERSQIIFLYSLPPYFSPLLAPPSTEKYGAHENHLQHVTTIVELPAGSIKLSL